MRILHTSDLHLGGYWRGESRRQDDERVIDEILGLCDEHNVDVLLVTGDILADRVEGTHAEVVRRLLEGLKDHLHRGRGVFLLGGNHDPFQLFELTGLLLAELAGGERWPLVVASRPNVYQIPGHGLEVAALPYLTPSMLALQAAELDQSPEAQVAGLSGRLAQVVEWLRTRVSGMHPAVFAAHVMVTGARLNEDVEFETGYHRELHLDPARLPQYTSYNALGHIHLCQEVRGTGKPTWYAGATDRRELGEREYEPKVLLVTVPDRPGGVASVEPLLVQSCTPFVLEQLAGQTEVDAFSTRVANRNPLGMVTIAGVPLASRLAFEDQLRRVAPRVRIQWASDGGDAAPVASLALNHQDVLGTLRAYLTDAFPDDVARRERLERAFEAVWSEPEEAGR